MRTRGGRETQFWVFVFEKGKWSREKGGMVVYVKRSRVLRVKALLLLIQWASHGLLVGLANAVKVELDLCYCNHTCN